MAITEYQLLEAGSPDELETLVTTAIASGWQPFEPPMFRPFGNTRKCVQAMTKGEDSFIETSVLTISTGELLALNATPKTLISAPGAGIAIVPVDILLFLDYNSAAYAGITAGEDLAFRYTNGSGNIVATVETTGFLDQTSDQHRIYRCYGEVTPTANAALVAHMTSGEITTGDSPLKVKIRYRLVTLLT